MKILFLTDNFPPEVNAPATRTYEHARVWVGEGHKVTVITCAPNFPTGKVFEGYRNRPYSVEYLDGIRVVRVWTYMTANEGFVKRTLDFISFSITSFLAGLFERCDVIIATSPQFFTALSGRTLSFFRRKPWIMEVRDLWPESIRAVGAMSSNMFFRYFSWQEKRCYRSAKKIVVVTDAFKKNLIGRGVPEHKISVIKNGANLELFRPCDKNAAIVRQLGLAGKTVVGYIGTHGMAHKLDFILDCAQELKVRGNTKIHFLFIGSGAQKQSLLTIKNDRDLDNVTMLDIVGKNEVKEYISVIDIALINLSRSELFRTVIPSKIFENAAMHKPILLGVMGESEQIIKTYSAGLCYEPENKEDFLQKLERLTIEPDTYERCKQGCDVLAADFDRKRLARNMLQVITSAAQANNSTAEE